MPPIARAKGTHRNQKCLTSHEGHAVITTTSYEGRLTSPEGALLGPTGKCSTLARGALHYQGQLAANATTTLHEGRLYTYRNRKFLSPHKRRHTHRNPNKNVCPRMRNTLSTDNTLARGTLAQRPEPKHWTLARGVPSQPPEPKKQKQPTLARGADRGQRDNRLA